MKWSIFSLDLNSVGTVTYMHILISNLSLHLNNNDLSQLFSVYGTVSYIAVIREKITGRSKGRAFLEMPNRAEAEQAIRGLNHTVIDGKEISVQEIEYTAGEFNN